MKKTKSSKIKVSTFVFKNTVVFVSKEWASFDEREQNNKSRKALKNELSAQVRIYKKIQKRHALYRTKNMPQFSNSLKLYTSISHTKKLGGFAISTERIGLDIESLTRTLSPKAEKWLKNIKDKSKFSPIELWVAKETAWKAIPQKWQPTSISKVSINSTQFQRKSRDQLNLMKSIKNKPVKNFLFTSKLKTYHIKGKGSLWQHSRFILGIAVAASKL
jgi:phosphopantetheinyl transferase